MHPLQLSIFLGTGEIQYLYQLRPEFIFFSLYGDSAGFVTLYSHMFCLQVSLSLLAIRC